MAETATILDLTDRAGKPITLVSETGKPRTGMEFASALQRYNETGEPGNGFIAAQPGMPSAIRKGFETIAAPLRQGIPAVSEAIGGVLGSSPLLMLGAKAGLIPGGVAEAPINAGRAAGNLAGELAAQPLSSLESTAMATGTGVAAATLPPIASSTGAMRVLPLLANMGKVGAAGLVSAETAALGLGRKPNLGRMAEEFAVSALSGGITSVVGYALTKFMPKQAEVIAKDIVREMTDANPGLAKDPNLMSMVGPRQIERIAQRMSRGLQDNLDDVTTVLVTDIKNTLPGSLSTGKQNTLRAHTRAITEAQSDILDSTLSGNADKLAELGRIADSKVTALQNYIAETFPDVKNINPTTMRVNGIIADYVTGLERFNQGLQVIDYMRKAGANKQWDPMQFAQLIRGEYQAPSNPLLERIGNILGGGRQLTEMSLPGVRESGTEPGRLASNVIKGFLPEWARSPQLAYKGAQTPWPAPSISPLQGMPAITAQEAGQSAMESYRKQGTK